MPAKLGEIAQLIDAELRGDPEQEISSVATLQNASAGSLSFLANRKYFSFLSDTAATAVVVTDQDADKCPVASLVTDDPYLGFVKAVRFLHPEPHFQPGIHPSATISSDSIIPDNCYVGPNTVVLSGVKIASGVYIAAGCVIGENVTIGEQTKLYANVTLCHGVVIGERNILHPGVVIGADGFGLAREGVAWLKIPQLGTVQLGNDVEIGANTTIDRGALENTILGNGVKIDNQVQIGHNVRIGDHTAIAGQVAIAGSVTIGKCCMIGGASAITGHIEIADEVVITGMSGVSNSIKNSGVYSAGIPVTDNLKWRKNIARFKQLDDLARRISRLESSYDEEKNKK